jgi:hypothetical protein
MPPASALLEGLIRSSAYLTVSFLEPITLCVLPAVSVAYTYHL